MPRKLKHETIDVNKCRAEWYSEHFDIRQMALHYPLRVSVCRSVDLLPRPALTIYGAPAFRGRSSFHYFSDTFEMEGYYKLSRSLSPYLDVSQLFWWYWSDAGWSAFERLWQELPEVVHMQVCTTGKVVHIRTQESYSYVTE